MGQAYETRRVGDDWGRPKERLADAMSTFRNRCQTLTAPLQLRNRGENWEGSLDYTEAMSRTADRMAHRPLGWCVSARSASHSEEDHYSIRSVFLSNGPAVIQEALRHLGTQYSFGNKDCSWLSEISYSRVGIDLPHSANLQMNYDGFQACSVAKAKEGDLLFANYGRLPGGQADHVGIKLDDTRWVDTEDIYRPVAIRVFTGQPLIAARFSLRVTGPH